MNIINKLKEWWNEPSWEEEFCEQCNEALVDYVRDIKDKRNARQEKLNSYGSMSERQLLIEIAKNTLKEGEE